MKTTWFRLIIWSGVMLFAVTSCSRYQVTGIQAENLTVSGSDTLFNSIIAPYRVQIDSAMNEVIGTLAIDMYKSQPESEIGNWLCDLLMEESPALFGRTPDFVVYNYGGLRLDMVSAGPITQGKLFELLPFENFVVMCTLDAYSTARLLEKIAGLGGWPVAGLEMTIDPAGEPADVWIHGKPLDPEVSYLVVMNDYMSNGGDGMDFMLDQQVETAGVTVRDLVITHIRKQTAAGNMISTTLDNRIQVGH